MTELPDDEQLGPDEQNPDETCPDEEYPDAPQMAEPYWMQDIRLAQRAIDEARARLRAAQSGGDSNLVS
jgi:hypothetical protein